MQVIDEDGKDRTPKPLAQRYVAGGQPAAAAAAAATAPDRSGLRSSRSSRSSRQSTASAAGFPPFCHASSHLATRACKFGACMQKQVREIRGFTHACTNALACADLHIRASVMTNQAGAPTSIEAALAIFANMGLSMPDLWADGSAADALLTPHELEGDAYLSARGRGQERASPGKPTAAAAKGAAENAAQQARRSS